MGCRGLISGGVHRKDGERFGSPLRHTGSGGLVGIPSKTCRPDRAPPRRWPTAGTRKNGQLLSNVRYVRAAPPGPQIPILGTQNRTIYTTRSRNRNSCPRLPKQQILTNR